MTLLKDLIKIPEHIDKGQFVLRLTEGVADKEAKATVETYVPTKQLVRCFDDALSFIRGALQGATSKATYLHGSFGSGKSHFMAILHLILQGNTVARGIPELAATIQKHNEWLAGKKFLLVPYHMIAAHDVESAILGGYVDYVRRVHPQAQLPGVYLAEGLFRDAQALRQRMGDAAFLSVLSETNSDFGNVDAEWDAQRFDLAVEAEPGAEERSNLISALVGKFFGSYDTQAGGHGEAFLSLDKGLSVISRHAKSLGYDGLILFLDELILWLASRAADLKFIHQEGQKLAKLVEAQTADRPVPIISFIARQRDLSELIGDSLPGANRLNFSDALKHWEGRFHKITLEDRNLPEIAEKRVLKCHTPSCKVELDAAFEQTSKIRESVMTTLLTSSGDREMFRKVYPFSPALVQTLIAVSSVLQRERTALRVMMQLLVNGRDTLEVGDIIPVGDLFDVIAHGDEAFSQEMAIHFDNAKRLYHQKLLPLLEKNGRRDDLEKLPIDDARWVEFRNNDRLIKTLLLSALVPEVESLRGLNAERLAALNHGTIRTPIPGRDAQEVLRRCRNWAASVGEIRVGEETNPTISVQLSNVDTDSIIKQAEREDNLGNRVRRVRQILFDQLGITGDGEFEQYHDFLWKNTKRSSVVLFKNIYDLAESSLENNEESWKLVIDYPFDEQGRGPRDDVARLQTFKSTHPQGTKTICWIPQFFSKEALHDLGLLVILEHILTGERFAQYSNHLSPQDRQAAKSMLENQRSVLKQRVQNHLDAAYGLEAIAPGSVDTNHELEQNEQFVSLWNGFDPQPPVAGNLKDAMEKLLLQALHSEFPGTPEFGTEVKTSQLKKVYEMVSAAIQTPDGRSLVDRPQRSVMQQIANPLLLGEMGHDATHFVLGHHWRNYFTKKVAETGGELSVRKLREWIDQPRRMGLPKEAQNLIILVFAEQTNRMFLRHNIAIDGTLTSLADDWTLAVGDLPPQEQWDIAVERAYSIFGRTPSKLLKASNVSNMSTDVKKQASDARVACQGYLQRLKDRLTKLGMDDAAAPRLKTAMATYVLVDKLQGLDTDGVVSALATAAIETSESAMGECLKNASQFAGTLDGANWEIFEAIAELTDERSTEAGGIRSSIEQALVSDEHVISLGAALKEAQAKAVRLLTVSKKTVEQLQIRTTQTGNKVPEKPEKKTVQHGSQENLGIVEAKNLLNDLDQDLRDGQEIRLNISWIIEEGGGAR